MANKITQEMVDSIIEEKEASIDYSLYNFKCENEMFQAYQKAYEKYDRFIWDMNPWYKNLSDHSQELLSNAQKDIKDNIDIISKEIERSQEYKDLENFYKSQIKATKSLLGQEYVKKIEYSNDDYSRSSRTFYVMSETKYPVDYRLVDLVYEQGFCFYIEDVHYTMYKSFCKKYIMLIQDNTWNSTAENLLLNEKCFEQISRFLSSLKEDKIIIKGSPPDWIANYLLLQ